MYMNLNPFNSTTPGGLESEVLFSSVSYGAWLFANQSMKELLHHNLELTRDKRGCLFHSNLI